MSDCWEEYYNNTTELSRAHTPTKSNAHVTKLHTLTLNMLHACETINMDSHVVFFA